MRTTVAVLRLATAGLIVAAVVAQWALAQQAPTYRPANFFGYFTIQSNLIGAVALVVGAVALLRRSAPATWQVVLRGAATAFLATTGVVYNTLLVDAALDGSFTLPWSNDVLHRVVPVLVVLDWLVVGDRRPITWRALPVFLAYPLVWLAVVLARGDDFVPYPFLDVARLGLGTVLLWCLAVAAFIGLASALVVAWSRADRALVRPERPGAAGAAASAGTGAGQRSGS